MHSADLRIAIIGCGFQGRYHAEAVAGTSGVNLIACCDLNYGTAEAMADSFPGSTWTDDPMSVFRDPDVDAVIIATTTNTHVDLALAAAAHGKHILLEKPMAVSVEDCIAIERAVSIAGVVLMMGFKFRFAPAMVAARRAVTEPVVVSAHTLYDAEQATSGWVNDSALSGGRLLSSLVHSVDALRYLADSEPVRITAEGGALVFDDLDGPDNAVATIRFENGVIGSIVHGTAGQSGLLSTWSFQTAGRGVNATVFDHGRRMRLHRSGEPPGSDLVDPVDDPFCGRNGSTHG